MVIMRREDGRLAFPNVLRSGQDADHIHSFRWRSRRTLFHRELLEVRTVVSAGLQADGAETLGDVPCRRPDALTAQPAALQLRRRQILHMFHQGLLRKHGRKVGQGSAGFVRYGWDGVAARRFRAEVDVKRGVRLGPLSLQNIYRFLPVKAEVGILSVVREFSAEAGHGRKRLSEDPAHRLLRIVGMALGEDHRMAAKWHRFAVNPNLPGIVLHDAFEESGCEAVLPTQQPHRPILGKGRDLGVEFYLDCVVVAAPASYEFEVSLLDFGGCLGRQNREDAGFAENLSNGGRRLARIELTEDIELRIDVDRQRFPVCGKGEGERRRGRIQPNQLDLSPFRGPDNQRDHELERRPSLGLLDCRGDLVPRRGLASHGR